jgi:hypothetical protein
VASQNARCPRCKAEAPVPDTFQHGDMLTCQGCRSQLRVLRSDKGALRLVVADPGPLKEELAFNRAHIDKLQADLRIARHSLGIGANGFGIAVLYVLARMGLEDLPLDGGLITEAAVVGVVVGVLLELANYFFLAKRKTMTRIGGEITQMREEQKVLQALIREAERGQQQSPNSSGIGFTPLR